MNASITFGEPNVIRVILGDKFYFFAILAYSNLAILHQNGSLIKIHNTTICRYSNTFFYLRLLCKYYIIEIVRVYEHNENITSVGRFSFFSENL
jgi:hypothetical protein